MPMKKNELRHDPITGDWTIVSGDSSYFESLIERGLTESSAPVSESCELCGGHEKETPPEIHAVAPDDREPDREGWQVRVVPNKSPVLQIHGELNNRGIGIYDVLDGIGAHEIVIETPEHGVALENLPESHIVSVFSAYQERFRDLKNDARFRNILLHKLHDPSKSKVSGHSFSHIIATPVTPMRVKLELSGCLQHFQYKERCLFCDIIHQEFADGLRVVAENEAFVALSPFAARSPFELMILPRKHETFFEWNTSMHLLASITRDLLLRLRKLVGDLHYVMVIHSGPNMAAGKQRGYWKTLERDYHWHLDILPIFKKIKMFEGGTGFPVNNLSPERATELLVAAKG